MHFQIDNSNSNMKKIFLIGFILLLGGCSLQSKVDGKTAEEWKGEYEKAIEKSNLLESNEKLLEKKRQCQQDGMAYKKTLYQKNEVSPEFKYSLELNTCLFKVVELLGSGGILRQITNIYSNEVLFSHYSDSDGDYFLNFGGGITRGKFDIEAKKLGF